MITLFNPKPSSICSLLINILISLNQIIKRKQTYNLCLGKFTLSDLKKIEPEPGFEPRTSRPLDLRGSNSRSEGPSFESRFRFKIFSSNLIIKLLVLGFNIYS